MFRVATTCVTPHTQWAKPYHLGRVKALFIIPRWTGREVVELAQRMDLDYQVAMVGTPESLSSADEKAVRLNYAAERPSQVLDRLYRLLNRDYDVIVVGNVLTTTLPKEAWRRIRIKVDKGSGLVLVPAQVDSIVVRRLLLPQARVAATPQTLSVVIPYSEFPAFARTDKSAPPVIPPVSLYLVGRGRVVLVHYDPGRGNAFITPPFTVTQRRQIGTAYDYYQSLVVKLVLAAANRLPQVHVNELTVQPVVASRQEPKEGAVRVVVAGLEKTAAPQVSPRPIQIPSVAVTPNPVGETSRVTVCTRGEVTSGMLRLRVRDIRGRRVVQTSLPLRESVTFPSVAGNLPTGRYFADAWVLDTKGAIVDWATTSFQISDVQGFSDFRLTVPWIRPRDVIRGSLLLKRPTAESETVWVKVSDFHDRTTAVRKLHTENTTKVDFEAPSGPVLSYTARVRAIITRGKDVVEERVAEIPVRQPATGFGWDDFSFMVWAFEDSYLRDLAYERLREAGMDRLMSGQVPHEEHIRQAEIITSQHNCTSFPYAWWVGDVRGCDYASVRESFGKLANSLMPYSCDTFSLGDEDNLTYYGKEPPHQITWPVVRDSFRAYLQRQYSSLESLNAEWNTAFKSWDEVEGINLADAKRLGQEARWADHRMHLESFFAEFFGAARGAVEKVNPSGRAGFEGAFQTDSFRGYDWWKLMQNINLMGNYWFTPAEWEFVGSFKRPDTYWGFWNGSYVDVFNRWCQRWIAWRCLLHGMNGVWYWQPYFGAKTDCAFGVYFPDLRLNPAAAPFLEAVREIKSGIGKLLLTSERVYPGIAIHYSQPSVHANTLDDAGFKPVGAGCPQQIHASWLTFAWSMKEAGIQPKFVSYEQVVNGELSKYKVFIMPFSQAVSPQEAAAIRKFAEDGGIVVADVRPGVRDGHCKLRVDGSLDDLFGVERAGNTPAGEHTDIKVRLSLGKHDIHGVFPFAQVDPNVKVTTGKALDIVDGNPVFIVNAVGKGLAILLNFTSAYSPGTYGDTQVAPVRTTPRGDIHIKLALGIASLGDVEPEIQVTTENHALRGMDIVTYHDGDASYYGFTPNDYCDYAWVLTMPMQMELRGETQRRGYFYDVRTGEFLGQGDAFRAILARGSATIVASLRYRVDGVTVSGPQNTHPGQSAQFQIAIQAASANIGRHVFRVEVEGPDGRPRPWYNANVVATNGQAVFALPLALSDPVGKWTIYAKDVATGSKGSTTFVLQPPTPAS